MARTPPDPATLAVVVVTYESAAVIASCLAALAPIAGLEVVIVDNASTDATVALARAAGHPVVVLDRNRGFAAAANVGAVAARAERLCFLNPDCVLTAEAVAAARTAWATAPDAVLVPDFWQQGARVAGRQPGYSPRKILADLLETRRAWPRLRARLQRHPRYHDRGWSWPLGTCLFATRSVFARAGGFDERYFLYMEDCELGATLSTLGVAIVALPVTVAHAGCGGSAVSAERRTALLDAARLGFAARHYGRPTAWALRAVARGAALGARLAGR
jgi:N-acetylglucosaminyl-diphospho-decaprenol L-rhamnosyltransferase